MERGEYRTAKVGKNIITVWLDTKLCYVLSNIHSSHSDQTVERKKGRETAQVPCPPVIPHYNGNMGGVDQSDQLAKYMSVVRRVEDEDMVALPIFCLLF